MTRHELQQLSIKISNGTATEKEVAEYNYYYNKLQEKLEGNNLEFISEEYTERELLSKINNRINFKRTINYSVLLKVAASVLLFCLTSLAYYIYTTKKTQTTYDVAVVNRIKPFLPGGNRAILILANGSKIALNNATNGTISKQGNVIVSKKDSQLFYQSASNQNKATGFNTVITPNGGQYQLTLQDGSKVWLNSSSTLKFPVAFSGNERDVELTGEAYFEVAKNKKMPFKVKLPNHNQVEVLGTHFNINAYTDEAAIKATLLEGSIKVSSRRSENTIKPGQQAVILFKSSEISMVDNIDEEEVMAWKNGLFKFDNTDADVALRQMARWYDVEIVYAGRIPQKHFGGEIPKNINSAQIFKMLKYYGIRLHTEGRKIIIEN